MYYLEINKRTRNKKFLFLLKHVLKAQLEAGSEYSLVYGTKLQNSTDDPQNCYIRDTQTHYEVSSLIFSSDTPQKPTKRPALFYSLTPTTFSPSSRSVLSLSNPYQLPLVGFQRYQIFKP